MGLDNGIKVQNLKDMPLPCFVKCDSTDLRYGELCYWRKCWGIRNRINALLHLPYDVYEIKVDREDLPAIIRVLKDFLHPTYWEENADSIWEYDDMIDGLIQQIMNLSWLYDYMEDHPDVVVTWYDSY